MIAAVDEDQRIVVHIVHTASAIHSAGHHCVGRNGVPVCGIAAEQMYIAAHGAVRTHSNAAGHCTFVASAIDGVDFAVQHYDIRNVTQVTFVVAAKDGSDIVGVVRILDVDKHFDKTVDSHTVATAIYGFNFSIACAVGMYIYKSVGLDRLVRWVAILHITVAGIVIVAVAATEHGVDYRGTADAYVSVYF